MVPSSESSERTSSFFPANPIAMRMNAAPRTAAYHLGVATLMVIVAWTPWGCGLLGVHPVFLTLTTTAFAIDLVDLARRVHDGSLFLPSAWPRRVLTAFVLLVYTASFAAPSEIAGSPAWIFLVMAGSIAGLIGTHLGPAFGGMALVAGPGLHLLTAPSISAFSVLVSVGAALSAWSAAVLGRRLSELAIELEREAETRGRLMSEAREDVRRLAAAMSIHDGLSGMFFGLRAKLETARTLSEVIAPIRAFSRRARELVLPASAPSSIVATLRALAELHGVPLTIHGAPTFSDPVEMSDIAFSATELVTNALRHRVVSSVTVTFLSGAVHGVSVRAEGPVVSHRPGRGADGAGGRGTRHLQLRAQAWGGESSRVDGPATSSAEVSWPRPRAHPGPLWLALLVPLSSVPLLALLATPETQRELVAYLTVVAVLTTLGLAYDARALRCAASIFLPRARPEAPISTTLTQELLGALERADEALVASDVDAVRVRMAEVGRALSSLLTHLETRAGQERSVATLGRASTP